MCYGRVIAVGMLIASAIVLPTSEASARCWHNGWGWRCGPGLLALPFVAAGAVVAGAAAIATAPCERSSGRPITHRRPPIIPHRAIPHRAITHPGATIMGRHRLGEPLTPIEAFTPVRPLHNDQLLRQDDGRA